MARRSVTREMPRLDMRASFEPSTVNVEKRTVQLTWTTGAPVLRGGFWTDPYWEELSLDPKHVRMGRLQSGAAPLLNTHGQYDLSDVMGVVEDAKLEGKRGTATVRFDSGPEGEDAFRKVREGILRNVSVGYRTYKMQKVEGGDATVPTYRAVDWEPYEISLVPIGADAGAVTRSRGETTPCEFVEERAMPPENETTNTTTTQASTTAAPAMTDAQRAEVAAAERERVLGIQRRGSSLGRPQAEIEEAIRSGQALDAFTARAVDARAAAPMAAGGPTNVGSPIVAGEDQREKTARGMTAWLVQRAGVADVVARAAQERPRLKNLLGPIDSDPGEFRGMTLVDMARRCLESANIDTRGMDKQQMVGKALTMREVTGTGVAASTSDFPNILENVLYKVLVAQYAVTPDTWRTFCKVGSVADFRANKRYRLGSFSVLDSLNELGEFKNKSIPDAERQSLTAATKGNIIGISRQAIINDDMSAFDSLATMFGRAAALSIEVDVYAALAANAGLGPTLSDGLSLFHANHNNISTQAALSAAALDLDRVAMKIQKDPSNNELLNLGPKILLIPATLGGQARIINDSAYDPDTLANKSQMKPNIAGKMFDTIIDTGRLSGTRRYLLADPGIAPILEVAFVDGQQQPFMDMQQGWRVDGVEWKVRLDYGVAGIDFRGAVTNAG
jgi:hypothetical protein